MDRINYLKTEVEGIAVETDPVKRRDRADRLFGYMAENFEASVSTEEVRALFNPRKPRDSEPYNPLANPYYDWSLMSEQPEGLVPIIVARMIIARHRVVPQFGIPGGFEWPGFLSFKKKFAHLIMI